MLSLLLDLEHSYPQVWRRIEVAADLRLDQLHQVICEAMGWEDVHLHGFRSAFRGGAALALPTLITDAELDDSELDHSDLDDSGLGDSGPCHFELDDSASDGSAFDGSALHDSDLDHSGLDASERDHLRAGDLRDLRHRPDWGGPRARRGDVVHESQVLVGEVLAHVGDVLHYDYDMACGWRHVITVEGVRPRKPGEPRAVLLAGERACPLEDCGGVWTYNDIVSVLTGEGVERLQTDPDDVLDQIDWLPEEFDPDEFDLEKARGRVRGIDLVDLPPPMPPLETLTPALADLVASCESKGRRALAHLLAEAGLDAFTLVEEHRRQWCEGERAGMAVVDTARALAAESGPAGPLPARLDEAACARMVAPFAALLEAVDRDPGGVPAGGDCPFPRGLVTAAVALGVVACTRGRLVRHPRLAAGSGEESSIPARTLATHIAQRLPIGVAPHEIDAGTLALLSAAAGLSECDILHSDPGARPHRVARLCQTVIEDAGWRTRAGRVHRQAMAFWANETWSVLSLLSGGDGECPPVGDPLPRTARRIPPDVQALARAALRISGLG